MAGDPSTRSARWPWRDGLPVHLPCRPGDVPQAVLMPGDPDRVTIAAGVLREVRDLGRKREFAMATGRWDGVPLAVCSTGIGGPSTEIAAVELAHLGARTLIRIGGMGAVDPDLPLGSFLIVEAAEGATGTASVYGGSPSGTPASPAVVDALEKAARALGLVHRRGRVRTTDSYYRGQDRPTAPDAAVPAPWDGLVERIQAAGVAGMDMEAEALFAVSAALGVQTGAVLAVHGHRITDRWLEDYEETQRNLVRLAATAVAYLHPLNPPEPSP
jgi:uridine phosphorylase